MYVQLPSLPEPQLSGAELMCRFCEAMRALPGGVDGNDDAWDDGFNVEPICPEVH